MYETFSRIEDSSGPADAEVFVAIENCLVRRNGVLKRANMLWDTPQRSDAVAYEYLRVFVQIVQHRGKRARQGNACLCTQPPALMTGRSMHRNAGVFGGAQCVTIVSVCDA